MSPLPSLLFPNMHHQTCSLTTWHYLSLSSSLIIGITHCLCLLKSALLLAWEICLSIEADNRMYIVSSSLMRVVFNSRLFLAAFRYISIILFRAAIVFGEEVNLHQGHGALFQAHNLSLHHLYDLQRVWVLAAKKIWAWACIYLTDSFSCTFTPSPVIPPVTRSLNGESGEVRWRHDWFRTDLIQISSVAFHTFLGRILVLFSCRAWQVCELLHCNVVLWCYGSWYGSTDSLLSRHSASALHTTSDICNCLVNVVWITISEVMPARNWLTRLITF